MHSVTCKCGCGQERNHEVFAEKARGGMYGTGELLAGECDRCHGDARDLFHAECEDCDFGMYGNGELVVYCVSCVRIVMRNHATRTVQEVRS